MVSQTVNKTPHATKRMKYVRRELFRRCRKVWKSLPDGVIQPNRTRFIRDGDSTIGIMFNPGPRSNSQATYRASIQLRSGGPISVVYQSERWSENSTPIAVIEAAIAILRRYMILDDLAGA